MKRYVVFENLEKRFEHIKKLGIGGTGETVLLFDEETKTKFAFKKYSPHEDNDSPETYERFIDEIAILFKLNHENIVRIYNYYLYREQTTGYIQMEYIEGEDLSVFFQDISEQDLERIFIEFITAFEYLESKGILHRDIRPQNFLIDYEGKLKVIDFGFGKEVTTVEEGNSVVLNWPVTITAEEINNGIYDNKTEVYYLGAMIQKEIDKNNIKRFKYENILEKMCQPQRSKRFDSFSQVYGDINKDLLSNKNLFSENQKDVFRNLVDAIKRKISSFNTLPDFNMNRKQIEEGLKNIFDGSILSENISNSFNLLSVFTSTNFKYWQHENIMHSTLESFLEFYESLDISKREIVINNIRISLSEIPVEQEQDILPF